MTWGRGGIVMYDQCAKGTEGGSYQCCAAIHDHGRGGWVGGSQGTIDIQTVWS